MNKRNLLIVSIVVIALSITGVTMAFHQTDKPKRSTTVIQDSGDATKTVTLETNTTPPTSDSATPVDRTVPDTIVVEPTPVASTDPVEQLHQTVIAQATVTAQLFAPNDVQNFIDIQWSCIGRSLGDNNQYIDAMSTWLSPKPNADGTQTYSYFRDRTCWVVTRTV